MADFDAVARIARRQHGTISRSQLGAVGFTTQRIRTLLATGILVRAASGIYLVAGTADTWLQRMAVAIHQGGPLALASHRAACALWRFDRFRPGHVDVATNWAGARTDTGIRLHRTTDLPARDRTVCDDLPVTSPTRTLIDMGRYVSATRLGSMVDDAVRRGLTTYEALATRHRELARPGRQGILTVRSVLEERPTGSPVPGSDFETQVRRLLRASSIADPVAQYPVTCDDVTYQLDFAWPPLLTAVECDGFRFHRTPEQLEWDDRRRTELGRRGWLVHHVTWRQLRHDPEGLVREVRRTLAIRAA